MLSSVHNFSADADRVYLSSARRLHSSGVSTDMGTTCCRSAGTADDVLCVQGEVVQLGRTLGFTRIEMRDAQGRLVAFGRESHPPCRRPVCRPLPHQARFAFSDAGMALFLDRPYEVCREESERGGESSFVVFLVLELWVNSPGRRRGPSRIGFLGTADRRESDDLTRCPSFDSHPDRSSAPRPGPGSSLSRCLPSPPLPAGRQV